MPDLDRPGQGALHHRRNSGYADRTAIPRGEHAGTHRYFPLIAAVLFAGLVVFGQLRVNGSPGTNESPAKILARYQTHKNHANSPGFLFAWGVIAGLAVFGCVFARFRQASPVLAATGLAGAAIFAISGLTSAGAYLSLGDSPGTMTASTAQALSFPPVRPRIPFPDRRTVGLLPRHRRRPAEVTILTASRATIN